MLPYLSGWLAGGVAAAAVVIGLLGLVHHHSRSVKAPPVHEIKLTAAARKARCVVDARHRQQLGESRPLAAGIYEHPVPDGSRERALRAGLIIIEYRIDVGATSVDELAAVQATLPAGTVLAPAGGREPDQLTATSYRRRLRCPRVNRGAFDALSLFRGRYVGSAPAR